MSDYESDIQTILGHRHDNGADYWASVDRKIYVGNPFSTLGSLGMLHELGVAASHEAVAGGLALILDACRDDGRIRLGPKAPMYPCYTAEAARVLCRFGLKDEPAVTRTVEYLVEAEHETGGWRCNFSKFGRGPETEWSNPGATLYVLDVLRFVPELRGSGVAERGVGSLLDHWESRAPRGPCHWGIGKQFLQAEYPFLRYNLFYFVYVLSFFESAKGDPRFDQALEELSSRLDGEGKLIVESRHRGLKGLAFCDRGKPSELATARYREIVENIARPE